MPGTKGGIIVTEFFTLDWLGTAAGMVAFVALMVEVCKFLVPVEVSPKWYCIGWSIVAMTANALWINPVVDGAGIFAAVVNTLLVAVAATGTFEYAIKPIERKILIAREAKQQDGESGDYYE
jgi:hypothetical protein